MSKDINQIMKEIDATLRLSGMELSVHDKLWLWQNAWRVQREETTYDNIVKELVEEYKQEEK